ncbi:hypothetical protein BN159_3872 [Streptomyces davaonensis JCM 4913]|uniref:Uncharacterized protein n=1 Tax=Streptomyces davaonensis (strain DSM 101723 / JCM 4913 / KCC S-0913 / 768) TaxID=1214101 RepID=K4QVZ3_STRDJ|nr:hypothetical protein [Streptomyces davaonensis]CCK28251.1 hypothetical protein BN159_3872 [Streptomyces davaonensis JCM 4913]
MVDPNFSGINPDNLLRTIKDLDSGSKTLHGAKSGYLSRFQKYGLDTSNLTEIGKIACWVDDELPMLRRRQALAVAMELDPKGIQKPGSMVQLREPVATVGEARRDGKNLADEAERTAKLDPSQAGAAFHRIAGQLALHKGDPDFTSAFYARMSPELAKNLQMLIAAADAPTAENDAKVFGSAFTTAINAYAPAPGFEKTAALFHGEFAKDEPTAVFNRALMQSDDPELWDLAWDHTRIAARKLLDPADTWSDSAGLLAGVIGMQAKYAGKFWEESQKFSARAAQLHHQRLNAMTPQEGRAFKKATRRAAKASARSAREAERILARFGMGSFSRLMEASIADGGSWLIGKVPGLRPPSTTTLFGRVLGAGGKLPLVGTVLTLGATMWDIEHGTEADVAVAANAGGMAAGTFGTWGGMALVSVAGGPVGWGIAAGVVLGFGTGYAISYVIKTKTGQKAVNSITEAAKSVGGRFGDAASSMKNTVGGWFS